MWGCLLLIGMVLLVPVVIAGALIGAFIGFMLAAELPIRW